MSRYIDADALLEKVQFRVRINDDTDKTIKQCVEITRNLIKNAPTADVAPVRHGQWEDRENPQWRAYEIRHCSVCGWSIHKTKLRNTDLKWKYCPNCGAKLDGEDESND